MYLIIGLGNPGEEYESTRHNVGFLAVDEFAKEQQLEWKLQKKLSAEISKNQKILLAKPQTFMNNSGVAVQFITRTYNLAPRTSLIVVHDEIDLNVGTIRISHNSSAAGHRGVQSIIDHLATKDFWRVRIGIRPITRISNLESRISTPDFVLKHFSKEEKKRLPNILEAATAILTEMIEKGPTIKTVHIQ